MSSLDFMKPFLHLLPEVETPRVPPSFPERLMWTVIALIMFFVMYHITALGVDPKFTSGSDFLQVVTASRLGSLITTGIGPIVLASIFLQLFAGAKIIDIDLQDPEQKNLFQGAQKVLAILLSFFEAAVFVFFGRIPVMALFPGEFIGADPLTGAAMASAPYTQILVVLQIALGSIILLFLDEVVSKHGIGSGISLFIAAGVSLSIVGGIITIVMGENGVLAILGAGGAEVIATAIIAMTPIFITAVVFLVIVYMEGMRVEIPLAFERARGLGTGFPIKLMYVSNIPVILASALLLNLTFAGAFLANQHWCIGGEYNPDSLELNKCEGGFNLAQVIGFAGSGGRIQDGFLYLLTPIYKPLGNDYGAYITRLTTSKTPIFGIPEPLHIVTYIIFLMIVCVIFGQFWVETTGMDAKSVAKQLDSAGLQIPGYRRDPRIVQALLEKYIPPIVIIGSAFVGLLAGLADLTGALGTGTGILLTVGIIYKLYEDIEKQNIFQSNALASELLGRR